VALDDEGKPTPVPRLYLKRKKRKEN